MSPSILRRLFVLGAALVVFGSVLFSRFTAPGVLPPQGSAEPRDAAWRFTGGTGVAVETGSSGAAGDVSNPIEVFAGEAVEKFTGSYVAPDAEEGRPPLTEAEIFRIQHPQYYLDYLKVIEDRMISDQFIAPGSHEAFDSEGKILNFWRDKGFSYFSGKGIVTANHRPAFLRGLDEVRRLHAEEVRTLNEFYRGGAAAEGQTALASAGSIPPLVKAVSGIFQLFLGTARANAQTPLCFQEGFSTPAPGINLIAPCCNCNVLGAPIGCLNLLCAGRAAIFDQTTFICGCG